MPTIQLSSDQFDLIKLLISDEIETLSGSSNQELNRLPNGDNKLRQLIHLDATLDRQNTRFNYTNY